MIRQELRKSNDLFNYSLIINNYPYIYVCKCIHTLLRINTYIVNQSDITRCWRDRKRDRVNNRVNYLMWIYSIVTQITWWNLSSFVLPDGISLTPIEGVYWNKRIYWLELRLVFTLDLKIIIRTSWRCALGGVTSAHRNKKVLEITLWSTR